MRDNEQQVQNKEQFSVCGRKTNAGTSKDLTLLQDSIYQYGTCPEVNTKDILLISGDDGTPGHGTFGRTGNNIIEFLHSLQFARDKNVNIGIMYDSWVFSVILELWMSVRGDDWQQQFEEAFCVKIFHNRNDVELEGYNVLFPDLWIREFTKKMFIYGSESPFAEYIGQQAGYLQTLFRHYNTGEGTTTLGKPVQNMCSGLDAVFGKHKYGLDVVLGKTYQDTIYTAIHSRKLEGAPGIRMMNQMTARTGVDPEGALDLRPDYIKSILRPLGMLKHPIVFISDGEDPSVLERLQADPEISQQLRVVPDGASSLGGDLTLAVMSNVFIGNPVSTFSGIIAKSRLALGFAHNYLWRAKDEAGNWHTVCGDTCIFDKSLMGVMA